MGILPGAPAPETIAVALVFYLAGAVTPWYFMQERLRGFGRWVASKIPYSPPPGEDTGAAMQDAVEAGERSPDGDEQ